VVYFINKWCCKLEWCVASISDHHPACFAGLDIIIFLGPFEYFFVECQEGGVIADFHAQRQLHQKA